MQKVGDAWESEASQQKLSGGSLQWKGSHCLLSLQPESVENSLLLPWWVTRETL